MEYFRAFSHLPANQYESVLDQSTQILHEFFNKSAQEHRIEMISMLNYLIENFPFGELNSFICIFDLILFFRFIVYSQNEINQ